MADKTYEFARWPSNEAYQKDPSILVSPAFDIIKKKTPFSFWFGPGQLSGADYKGWAILTWDKSDLHKAFAKEPDHDTLIEYFKPTFADASTRDTVSYGHFKTDPSPIFKAPVTAVTFVTVKAGVSHEQATALLDSATGDLAAWGTVEGTSDTFVLIEGAASVDALAAEKASFQESFTLEKSIVKLEQKQ